MSQGGSAPQPASRQSSRSPARATDATSSPPLQRSLAHQDDPRSRPLHDPVGVARAQGEGRGQQAGSRVMDPRDMLNSIGPHAALMERSPSLPQHSASATSSHAAMAAARYGSEGSPSNAFVHQAPGATTPQSTNPSISTTASAAVQPTSTDRHSPQTVHPYPMAARRILTPRSPRTASLSRAALRTVEPEHLASTLPAPPARGTATTHDYQLHGSVPPSLGTAAQFHNSVSGQISPTRPTAGLSRSLSQPSLGLGLPSALSSEPQQSAGLKREHSGRPVVSGPPFPPSISASRPFGGPGGLGEAWGLGPLTSLASGGSRGLQLAESPALFAITPQHGEEIVVPVDMQHASRHADQKRQRNAGASARFRQRKKEREKEQQEELQKLENENRDLDKKYEELAKRYEELEAERDFYRSERNRLRDALSQTPGMKEWADRGLPSPISRPAAVSFAPDAGTLLTHPQPPPPPPPPPPPATHAHSQYQHHPPPFGQSLPHTRPRPHPRSSSYGDPSELEPPARRRRTDSEPQLPSSSYSLMTSTHLPPITSPAPLPPPPPPPMFGMPPSPHVTPPPGIARLPPLRLDQARTPSTTPPPIPTVPPQPQPQPADPYVAGRRLPYGAGWATDPRGHPDNGSR